MDFLFLFNNKSIIITSRNSSRSVTFNSHNIINRHFIKYLRSNIRMSIIHYVHSRNRNTFYNIIVRIISLSILSFYTSSEYINLSYFCIKN